MRAWLKAAGSVVCKTRRLETGCLHVTPLDTGCLDTARLDTARLETPRWINGRL